MDSSVIYWRDSSGQVREIETSLPACFLVVVPADNMLKLVSEKYCAGVLIQLVNCLDIEQSCQSVTPTLPFSGENSSTSSQRRLLTRRACGASSRRKKARDQCSTRSHFELGTTTWTGSRTPWSFSVTRRGEFCRLGSALLCLVVSRACNSVVPEFGMQQSVVVISQTHWLVSRVRLAR